MIMTKLVAILCLVLGTLSYNAQSSIDRNNSHRSGREKGVDLNDSVMMVDGYYVRCVEDGDSVKYKGLILFSDEIKKNADKEMLESMERRLWESVCRPESDNKIIIIRGDLKDLRDISPDTPCTIKNKDSKEIIIEWSLEGKRVIVSSPINYDIAKLGSRSDIEQDFISKVKGKTKERKKKIQIEEERIESYGDLLFVLPGASYQNKHINRNAFFEMNESLDPVWRAEYPLESIGNCIVFPSEKFSDIKVRLTILKHEYGEKETIDTTINQLIAIAEAEGCLPYWGVEKYENGILEGAIFLYNHAQGYDHVIKISCNPVEIISGNGEMNARASLYIPTNNVDNLFAPDIKETVTEKIRHRN